MFDNIGGKIKGLAKFICWAGIIISIIGGIVIIASSSQSYGYYYGRHIDGSMVATGIVVMVVGSLCSWIGSFVLYGFGELVENSEILVRTAKKNGQSVPMYPTATSEEWTCRYCSTKNSGRSLSCKECGRPKD